MELNWKRLRTGELDILKVLWSCGSPVSLEELLHCEQSSYGKERKLKKKLTRLIRYKMAEEMETDGKLQYFTTASEKEFEAYIREHMKFRWRQLFFIMENSAEISEEEAREIEKILGISN